MSAPRPVAVVGATGFVGQATVQALIRRGHRVIRVHSPRISPATRMEPDFLEVFSEVVENTGRAIAGCRAVVIASGNPDASSADSDSLTSANALSPAIVAAAAKRQGIERLVYTSSAVVQGDAPRLDDGMNYAPFSPYARSKILGERMVLRHGPAQTVVYRPPSVHAESRRVTRRLAAIARSPFRSVAGNGDRPTPQALIDNVADAIAFLATTRETPPPVVSHPSEGLTTGRLLEILGGRVPRKIPVPVANSGLLLLKAATRALPWIAPNVRRIELIWFGQEQGPSWLTPERWTPPVGLDEWVRLAASMHRQPSTADARRHVLYGVTTGIVVRSFFEGQFARMADEGWRVSLLSTEEAGARDFAVREGADFYATMTRRQPTPLADLKSLIGLVALVRRIQPDITVWGTPKMGLLGGVASRFLSVPSVYVVHGLRFESETGLKRRALMMFERLSCAFASDVVAVGKEVREAMLHARIVRPNKVKIIANGSANGVPAVARRPGARARLRLPEDDFICGFVGRVTGDKGILDLLAAWQEVVRVHPSAVLLIVGMFEKDALKDPIASVLAKTTNTRILGHQSDLSDAYSAIDLLVLPSYREGLPTVVLEAARYQVPAVVSDATGASEPVLAGETGLVVPARNPDALAAAIIALASDPNRRAEMGARADAHVTDRYDRKTVQDAWRDYLEDAVRAAGQRSARKRSVIEPPRRQTRLGSVTAQRQPSPGVTVDRRSVSRSGTELNRKEQS